MNLFFAWKILTIEKAPLEVSFLTDNSLASEVLREPGEGFDRGVHHRVSYLYHPVSTPRRKLSHINNFSVNGGKGHVYGFYMSPAGEG